MGFALQAAAGRTPIVMCQWELGSFSLTDSGVPPAETGEWRSEAELAAAPPAGGPQQVGPGPGRWYTIETVGGGNCFSKLYV